MFTVMSRLITKLDYDTLLFQRSKSAKYMEVLFSRIHCGGRSNCDIVVGFVFFLQTFTQCNLHTAAHP